MVASRSEGRGYPKGDRRRAAIVDAAFGEFSRLGYRHGSVVQIAAAVGVSRAGLLHHFPNKQSLLVAVLQERDRINGELFWQGFEPESDGVDYFARLIRTIEHNASIPGAVSLFAMLSTEASDPAHPAHAFFVDRYRWLLRDVGHALDDLDARGLLRAGVARAGLERDVVALMDGLQVQWLLDPEGVDMAERLRMRVQDLLTCELP